MLYVFGFEQLGVVVSDLYFLDPKPGKGQEGAEHGVRLELRALERGALKGTIYSAQPIEVGQPIWRVDLLETVAGPPGSADRTHHHPAFRGWDPGPRVFARELTADPLGWLGARLADLDGVLAAAGFPADAAGPGDAESLRRAAPEIVDVTRGLLARVRSGELGNPPAARAGGPAGELGNPPAARAGGPAGIRAARAGGPAGIRAARAGGPAGIRAGWL
jgi:hypothetical protein